eukprot:1151611-Pelagomonas_calceolata.AAC.6
MISAASNAVQFNLIHDKHANMIGSDFEAAHVPNQHVPASDGPLSRSSFSPPGQTEQTYACSYRALASGVVGQGRACSAMVGCVRVMSARKVDCLVRSTQGPAHPSIARVHAAVA